MIAVVKLRILPPMDIVMDAVQDACEEVLDTGSRAELEQVQQEIITIQEAVLVLHKDQQQGMLSNEDYDLKVAVYSQQMDTLQEQQRELKATAGRYAEVKYWLDAYREHVQSGEKMDTDDAVMIRSLTDKIVVYDDRMEIHLRIGEIIEKVIRACRGDVYWIDKHFRKEGLEMLIDGLPYQGVKSVTIISGKDNLTASAKSDYFSLQTELAQRQIVLNWRVIENSAFKWHDRWLVADNQCHNIPPVRAIIRGQRSEILSTEERLDILSLFGMIKTY